MSRVRVWYDDECDQIFISGETHSFAPRSLICILNGGGSTLYIQMRGTEGSYIAGGSFADFGNYAGLPFDTPEDAKAYLDGVFGKKRSLGFTFTQSEPSLLWVIRHALGFKPGGITLVDTAGDPMTADWHFPDADTVTLTFNVPAAGTAYLS